MKYIRKNPETVEAIQWFKSKHNYDVTEHTGCNYRMCDVCGGNTINSSVFYIRNNGYIKYINDSDWIVKINSDIIIYNNKDFEELYKVYLENYFVIEAFELTDEFNIKLQTDDFNIAHKKLTELSNINCSDGVSYRILDNEKGLELMNGIWYKNNR